MSGEVRTEVTGENYAITRVLGESNQAKEGEGERPDQERNRGEAKAHDCTRSEFGRLPPPLKDLEERENKSHDRNTRLSSENRRQDSLRDLDSGA